MNRRTILAVLLTAAVLPAAPAHAAPYTVWACATPSAAPAGPGDWQPERLNGTATRIQSTCLNPPGGGPPAGPAGSMDAFADPNHLNDPRDVSAGWTVAAPPGVLIRGLELWWYNAVPDPGAFAPGRIQVATDKEAIYARDNGSFGASGALSPLNRQQFPSLETGSLAVRAWCSGSCNDDAALVSAHYSIYRARLLADDVSAPTGNATGLTDGMTVSAPTPIQASARDFGSGISEITLRVDGQVVQRAGGDRCPDIDAASPGPDYLLLRPCPPALAAPLTLPVDALPDNDPHRVTVTATDAAGQDTTLATARVALAHPDGFYDPRRGFSNPDLDITADRAVNGGAGGPARLSFGLLTPKRRTVAHRTLLWNETPVIVGRLISETGSPVSGARVWLATETTGVWRLASSPLITDTNGGVTAKLPARAASRRLQLVYFPYTDVNGYGSSRVASVTVRAGASLTTRTPTVRAGGRARLLARLRTPVATGSVIGTVQLRSDGHWRTFRQVRFAADAPARRVFVRFRHSPPGTVYKMRLRIPPQTGWPYATGTSRTVIVTVR